MSKSGASQAEIPLASFEDRVVLITGGSSGIGLAAAIQFAKSKAKIAIIARDDNHLNSAKVELEVHASRSNVLSIPCDVTDEQAVIHAYDLVYSRFKRLDIVVNNAGTIAWGSIQDTTLATWNAMMEVHCTGYFLVAREAIRRWIDTKQQGNIVFVVSDNAIKPSHDLLAYNVAKAAELHMARCIADECGEYGIRVNSILPGAVFGRSNFWTPEFRASRALIHNFDPNRLEEEYKKNTALGVTILPEEVADLIVYLASDRSKKVTGAVISIDGGGKAGYVR